MGWNQMTLRLKPSYMEWKPNELADALKNWLGNREQLLAAANMLLDQAKEIERYHNMLHDKDVEITTLKQIIDANNLMSDIGQFKKAREK